MKILFKNKIIALLLAITAALSLFAACKMNRSYDEEEVASVSRELIKRSEVLNVIYYGEGIKYIEDASYANGAYYKADPIYLAAIGIETLDDLKKETREVFSEGLSNIMINTALAPFVDDSGVQRFSRYYQKFSALDDTPECIMVYKDAPVLLTSTLTYDYKTLKVLESAGDIVYVSIDAEVENKDGKRQKRQIKIGLIEEKSGWKLDTSTYVNYADLDYYYDMQNKEN